MATVRPGSVGSVGLGRTGELGLQPEDANSVLPVKSPSMEGSAFPAMMPDADAMKAQVRKNLLRPQYDVRNLYREHGTFQHLARHPIFESLTLVVISFNAIWLSIDTDNNDATVLLEASPIFQVAEHFFCCYFAFELTVRFMSFKRKRDCFTDGWFVFDSALVFLMVAETWVMTTIILLSSSGSGSGLGKTSILRIARLMRLSRMARMVRLFRAMPELLILIKGMVAATRSVFFTLCLLIIVLYIFGIALRQLTDGEDIGITYFPSVPDAMYTLLIYGTFLDSLGQIAYDLLAASPVITLLFWLFVLMSNLTVLNMLIGVLCEVVSAVAASEKETLVVTWVKEKMAVLFEKLDESRDGFINKEEFLQILQKPEAARLLVEVGVDVISLIDQAETIFIEEMPNESGDPIDRALTFEDLMEVILELRGTNHASVKHIVDLRKVFMTAITQTNKAISRLEVRMSQFDGEPILHGGGGGAVPNASDRKPPPKEGKEKDVVLTPRGPGADECTEVCRGLLPRLQQARLETAGWLTPMPTLPAQAAGLSAVATSLGPLTDIGCDVQALVERLEQIAADVRVEIQRELSTIWQGSAPGLQGRGTWPLPDSFINLPGTPDFSGSGKLGPDIAGPVWPLPMPPTVTPSGVRELEDLRGKLAGLVGSVAGVAELRRIRAQLQHQDQALGASFTRPWRPH